MQFLTCISRSETPLHDDPLLMASLLPGSNDGSHAVQRRPTLIEALTSPHTPFTFCQVQPASVILRDSVLVVHRKICYHREIRLAG
jgi:hypothetical protein